MRRLLSIVRFPSVVVVALTLACVGLPACSLPSSEPAPAGEPALLPDPQAFSGANAYSHLQALVDLGPRASGTPGAERAREYLRDQLQELGLEVSENGVDITLESGDAIRVTNLVAEIPGKSSDLFVLAAPYDTRYFASFEHLGANDGASGAALLLELARVLSQRPLEYTTWLVFLDGEAPLGRGTPDESATAWIGSTSLSKAWLEDGTLERIRLLVYLNQVADPDLRIARDLRSHRSYREVFWETARRMGYTDEFSGKAEYESPVAGHVPFVFRGMRRSVLVMDTSFGGDEPPGLYAGTEDDTAERCSPDSLEAVGRVTVASVDRIAARLSKIDRFADAPLGEPESPPPPSRTPPPAEGPSGASRSQPAGSFAASR